MTVKLNIYIVTYSVQIKPHLTIQIHYLRFSNVLAFSYAPIAYLADGT